VGGNILSWIRNVIVLAFVFLVSPSVAASRLEIKLSQSETMAGKGRAVIVVEAKNVGDRPLYLFGPHTPFALVDDRLQGKWFRINDVSGAEVRYAGRHVFMRGSSPESYIQLVPGESIRAEVDLGKEYTFTSSGVHQVSTSMTTYTEVPAAGPDGELSTVPTESFRSAELDFYLDTSVYTAIAAPSADNVFPCSEEQLGQTRQAFYKGSQSASLTRAILANSYYYGPVDPQHPEDPPRIHMRRDPTYVYWFGEWDDDAPQAPDPAAPSTDNARVDEVVVAIAARMAEGFPTVCDRCPGYSPFTRAWTEGDGTVHMCPVHFSDPISGGVTSQAGTLVHEASHIDDARARPTVDHDGVINRATAHALDRPRAVHSGANYEYYVMNVPLGF
jgi:hypothetical protein